GQAPGTTGVRAGERPRDDDLRRGPLAGTLRKTGRVRVAGRIQEGVRVVDAVVDDADLDSVASGTRGLAELVGADHRRARVGREVIPDAGIDLPDEAESQQLRQL